MTNPIFEAAVKRKEARLRAIKVRQEKEFKRTMEKIGSLIDVTSEEGLVQLALKKPNTFGRALSLFVNNASNELTPARKEKILKAFKKLNL